MFHELRQHLGFKVLGNIVAYRLGYFGITEFGRLLAVMYFWKLRKHCHISFDYSFLQYKIVVQSRQLFEAVRHALVDRVVPETCTMGGGHPLSILSSTGSVYQRQRSIVHGEISRAGRDYRASLEKHLQLFEVDDGNVDLFNVCACINRQAMADALGLPLFHYSARVMNWLVWLHGFLAKALMLPKCMSDALGYGLHELAFARESRRVARLIHTTRYAMCDRFVREFGLPETMGHLWAIVNGSSIPESSIVCDIVAELADSMPEQELVLNMLERGEDRCFQNWIREQLRKHVYFPFQVKVLSQDTIFDGLCLAAGQNVSVSLKWLNEVYDEVYTTGFGLRRCPGASIGLQSVEHWVAHIVRNYHVVAPSTTLFLLVSCLQRLYPYQSWSMGVKYFGRGCFRFVRRA